MSTTGTGAVGGAGNDGSGVGGTENGNTNGDNHTSNASSSTGAFFGARRPNRFSLEEEAKFKAVDCLFRAALISVLADNIVGVYMHMPSRKDMWDALEAKFGVSDAGGRERFLLADGERFACSCSWCWYGRFEVYFGKDRAACPLNNEESCQRLSTL